MLTLAKRAAMVMTTGMLAALGATAASIPDGDWRTISRDLASTRTAIDANTGAIKWAVPLGLVEALPQGKQLRGNMWRSMRVG